MTSPKHEILLHVINEMVDRILNNEPNIFLATGPTLISDVIFYLLTGNKIYNTNINIQLQERLRILKSSNMNGLFEFEDSKNIVITFPGYSTSMLYNSENPRYAPTWGGPSHDLYN